VNRESQKSILIGKKGAKIKEIGSKAREKLEVFLDRKVFLQLFVKVDEDWRTKKDSLEKFGYIDSDFG
jgi:GTP-binding protein Era